MWPVATTGVFDEWCAALGHDAQAEIIAKVELLKLLGPKLGRPHADTLSGSKHANMKELRAATASQMLRIAFAFDTQRVGILLVADDKRGVSQRRFYKQLIEKADELFDIHLATLKDRRRRKDK
jgi:hypothetical protein